MGNFPRGEFPRGSSPSTEGDNSWIFILWFWDTKFLKFCYDEMVLSCNMFFIRYFCHKKVTS